MGIYFHVYAWATTIAPADDPCPRYLGAQLFNAIELGLKQEVQNRTLLIIKRPGMINLHRPAIRCP